MRLVDGKYERIGTVYGMPSGDSMHAAIICYLLFKKEPIFSVLLWLSVCCSRVLVGYHNVLQVIAGSFIGFLYMVVRDALDENIFVIGNWILAALLPLLAFTDRNLVEVKKCDYDNIQLWVIVDNAYLSFDIIYCAPESLKIFKELSDGWLLILAASVAFFWNFLYQYLYINGISISKKFLK